MLYRSDLEAPPDPTMSTGDPSEDQVAEAPPPAGGAEGQEQAQPQHSWLETLKTTAVRIMIVYFIMNFFKKYDSELKGSGEKLLSDAEFKVEWPT